MIVSGRLRWLWAVLFLGVVYLVAGIISATLANQAASEQMRVTWRLAAWLISAGAFAAHIGYEHVRLRSSPGITALHASLAVAMGAFALALSANVHALAVSSHQPSHILALVLWPVVTALPAFVVALAAAAGLALMRPRPTPRLFGPGDGDVRRAAAATELGVRSTRIASGGSMSAALNIPGDDTLAVAVISAIHEGEVDGLQRLLNENPGLATARIVDARGGSRTLLHIVADWPGHFPNGARTVTALIAAGAEVNAPFIARAPAAHAETPLHWAASSNDVAVLDALLDGGADIEASGAVFTGGAPMSDAVVFAQWQAARRLLERGARTTFPQAAALGLLDPVKEYCTSQPPPSAAEITNAFWNACRGGQRQTAEYLLVRGADLNWIGWDQRTPLDVAQESGANDLIEWLRNQGGTSAKGSS